jgi:RNA recognition motif-containing protein
MSDTISTTQVHVEEDGHKVFVGNLSFQTTEAELSELFSKPTPVLRANIITHGTRSRGYGFVAYETLAQAQQAATTYNKIELGGREINVEVAKPKVERAPAAPKAKTPKQPKADTLDATEGDADVKPRTGRNNRPRGSRKSNRNKNEGEEGTVAEDVSSPASADGEAKEGARRKRSNRRSGRKGANGDAAATEGGVAAPSAPSAPRQVGPPSKTTVFVANLPFSMEDAGLKELFAQFKVASAHVVRRRGSRRSKGFGFVELVDEAEQQNVIEKMKDATADGRELVIKVALSEEHHSEKDGETAQAEISTA